MSEAECVFFRIGAKEHLSPDGRTLFAPLLWHPTVRRPLFPGGRIYPYGVWTLFHWFRVFTRRDYGQLLLFAGTRVIHRSGVYPRFFRFPFMGPDDLQIGDTWTHPAYRGQGAAVQAIQEIVRRHARSGRWIWYVTETINQASIRVAEKAGLMMVGHGVRSGGRNPFSVRYLLTDRLDHEE